MLQYLIIFCVAIILYPFLLMAWQRREDIWYYSKKTLSRAKVWLADKNIKTFIRNRHGALRFRKLFQDHFNPQNGAFPDDALRRKVYELYMGDIQKGESYKALRTFLAGRFFPDRASDHQLLRDEREALTLYFFTHFPDTETE